MNDNLLQLCSNSCLFSLVLANVTTMLKAKAGPSVGPLTSSLSLLDQMQTTVHQKNGFVCNQLFLHLTTGKPQQQSEEQNLAWWSPWPMAIRCLPRKWILGFPLYWLLKGEVLEGEEK